MKTPLHLNIGLNTTHGTRVDVHTAVSALYNVGTILASRVVDSPAGAEQTLAVAILPCSEWKPRIYSVAVALGQDCIAVHDGATGELIGPNSEAWGDFQPAFFIRPETGEPLEKGEFDPMELEGVRECTQCNDGSCAWCAEEIRQALAE